MKTFVVDASTSLKWVFDDEIDTDSAKNILKDYLANRIQLIAPDLWIYEIANAIRSALLRTRITLSQSQNLLELLLKAKPQLITIEPLISESLHNSNLYGISLYDSAYLTLARESHLSMISADQKISSHPKLKQWIVPLQNY